MTFIRPLVNKHGNVSQPMRAGDGFAANLLPANFESESDETLLVPEVSGGSVLQGLTLTSDVTYTLPEAVDLLAEFGEMDISDSFSFYVGNNQAASFDVILAVGAGITAVGTNNNLTVGPQAGKIFTLIKTSATTMDLY
ncbi:MAG: hypothetical protein COB66_01275 [Coxiella sp. (in: Bacteria)]|nr:MAG: hypothetical protein COB66_01275 [Coxiella sp. (in: g-proteobacteria)]